MREHALRSAQTTVIPRNVRLRSPNRLLARLLLAQSDGAGKGATFSASFPLLTDRVAPSTTTLIGESYAAEWRSLDGLRVLLVDDEIETRKILSTVVERTGAEVKTCTSASEALATLVQWRPHVREKKIVSRHWPRVIKCTLQNRSARPNS